MENDLQINITAVDNASEVLDSVAENASAMVDTVAESAQAMTVSFTDAEMAWIDQAEATVSTIADAYEGLAGDISASLASATEAAAGGGEEAGVAYGAAFDTAVTPALDLSADLNAFMLQGEEAGTAFGEGFEESGSTAIGGAMGVFKIIMAAAIVKMLGDFVIAIPEGDVAAAAGVPDKISALQAQIQTLQASIDTAKADLTKFNGTNQVVGAAHEKDHATINTDTVKIDELKRQLDPLNASYEQSKTTVDAYNTALLNLGTDQSALAAAQGNTILPMLTQIANAFDDGTKKLIAFANAHPQLTEAFVIFLGVLGILLLGLAALLAIWGILAIAAMLLGGVGLVAAALFIGGWLLIVVAIAVAVALIIVYHKQIEDAIKAAWDWIINVVSNAMLWIYDHFKSWGDTITKWWNGLWDGIYSYLEGIWTKIEGIVNTILNSISKVTSAVSGIIGGTVSGIGNAITKIPAFATGGIVNSPTLALVGEAGPEAIIPLSAFNGGGSLGGSASGAGGNGNIIVNITGTFLSQDAARQIGNMLADGVNRQIKMRNYS